MKKVFFIIFLLLFCFAEEETKGTTKENLKEFTDITFVAARQVTHDIEYFYLPDDFARDIFSFEFNFNKAIFFDGIFHFFYEAFGLYGKDLANHDFGIGLDFSYHFVNLSAVGKQYGNFQKLKLGVASDINHLVFLPVISSFSIFTIAVFQSIFNVGNSGGGIRYSGVNTMFAAGIGTLIGIVATPFLAYIPLMVNHYLQPLGFYFHSVAGVFYDGLYFSDNNNNQNKEKSYDIFGGYFGIKMAWKFLQAKKFSIVLKTGIIKYFTNINDISNLLSLSGNRKENYYSIPLEIGISF